MCLFALLWSRDMFHSLDYHPPHSQNVYVLRTKTPQQNLAATVWQEVWPNYYSAGIIQLFPQASIKKISPYLYTMYTAELSSLAMFTGNKKMTILAAIHIGSDKMALSWVTRQLVLSIPSHAAHTVLTRGQGLSAGCPTGVGTTRSEAAHWQCTARAWHTEIICRKLFSCFMAWITDYEHNLYQLYDLFTITISVIVMTNGVCPVWAEMGDLKIWDEGV